MFISQSSNLLNCMENDSCRSEGLFSRISSAFSVIRICTFLVSVLLLVLEFF
jgi:hypothetical protein